MTNNNQTGPVVAAEEKVHDAARDVVDEVHAMRKHVGEMAKKVGDKIEEKIDETKPYRDAAKQHIVDAADSVEDVAEGVVKGVKDGIADAKADN